MKPGGGAYHRLAIRALHERLGVDSHVLELGYKHLVDELQVGVRELALITRAPSCLEPLGPTCMAVRPSQ